MFQKIIALQGKGGSGKTTTIKLLRQRLIDDGLKPHPSLHNNSIADFVDILTDGIRTVGITSFGDSYKILNKKLIILNELNVPIAICACRTKEMVPGEGTIGVLSNYANNIEFISKTMDNGRGLSHDELNRIDVEKLFQAFQNWWIENQQRRA